MSSPKGKKQGRKPPPHQVREQLAACGDVRGFLEHILVNDSGMIHPNTGSQLTRCLKKRSHDVDGLCEDGFALSIELAVGILARVSHVIHAGLHHHDDSGRPLRSIPHDLLPWLDRAERLSRFITELASARARYLHLRQIAETGGGDTSNKSRSKKSKISSADTNGHARQNGNGTTKQNGVHRLVDVMENHRG